MKKNITLPLAIVVLAVFLFSSCKKKNESVTPANQQMIDKLGHWGDSLTRLLVVDSVNLSAQGVIFYVNDPVSGLDYTRAFGTSDVSTSRFLPLQPEDLFRIGTFTNTFTTTVFLQLVQDGVLNLDDHINKYFNQIPHSDSISLRQVANMTSGIFDYADSDSLHNIWASDPLRVLTHQQLLDFALANQPYFLPGMGCHYSHTNNLLMGMIIESVTGKSLSDNYRSRILETLHLNNTTFPENQYMPFYATYCHGYEYFDTIHTRLDVSERFDPSWAWGSANLISKLSELQTFLPALVNGTLLTSTVQQERMQMIDWETVHGIPLQYGLGIMGISGYFGHLGDIQGYHCICMLSPSTGRTIIIFVSNGSASPLLMFAKIANLLSPGLIPVIPLK